MYRKNKYVEIISLISNIYARKICVKFKVLKLFGCQGDEHLKFGAILNEDTVC
jgi:hypothetical protein